MTSEENGSDFTEAVEYTDARGIVYEYEDEPLCQHDVRWKIGTVVGICGFVAFVVIGLLLTVSFFFTGTWISERGLALFPWMIGALGVGCLGIIIAGALRKPFVDEDTIEADAAVAGAASR